MVVRESFGGRSITRMILFSFCASYCCFCCAAAACCFRGSGFVSVFIYTHTHTPALLGFADTLTGWVGPGRVVLSRLLLWIRTSPFVKILRKAKL